MHIVYHFFNTARHQFKVANFSQPHLYLHPVGGDPHWNFTKILGARKLEYLGYRATLFA